MEKQYEIAKRDIINNFLKKEDNILLCQKIFIAISILKWASVQQGAKELFPKYISYITKFLNNEIDLYWEKEVVKFKPIKTKR